MEKYFDLLDEQDNVALRMAFPDECTDAQYAAFEQRYRELNDEIALAYREYEMELD